MPDDELPAVDLSEEVDTDLNGHGKPSRQSAVDAGPPTSGAGLIFVAVVSGLTWISGFLAVTAWSVIGYLVFSGRDPKEGVDFIADGIYFGFPLGAALGLWAGIRLGLRVMGGERTRRRILYCVLGGGIALAAVIAGILVFLTAEQPIRLVSVPVIGPVIALIGLIAPGLGAAYGRLVADRSSKSPPSD